ncbi:phage exclusion protein Lit family protein [Microvirga sp. VF16]|uniref:phage exclusion protein Lit family protein n=1 Tax=Microvirga sp. VF16 TaxID=2807101 RepID=UPI00193C9836|nr:phage exclusion protein Lit family protein [Microvirga sp. VF16]QRM36027.1 hypothetical protein JO965_47575 [Microvirga sp. VF16]
MDYVEVLFSQFRPQIDALYKEICQEAQVEESTTPLAIMARSFNLKRHEAEFAAVIDPSRVWVTWNGLASLWAFSHAVIRIGREMFEAQRAADASAPPPTLPIAGEVEVGLHLFTLSLRLAKNKFDQWVDWAPLPDTSATSESERAGNELFLRALGWILRHELGHHVLNHHESRRGIPEHNKQQEFEADEFANNLIKADYSAEAGRLLGTKPKPPEIELERRALATFVGLTWVAQFELSPHGESSTHPDTASRIARTFELLALADDSFSAEMLSYVVKVLIDPEGEWPPREDSPTAADGAIEAMIRLTRHISEMRG